MACGPAAQQPSEIDRMRVEFARNVFGNVQELIRFVDQKAGFVMAVLALLTAGLLALVGSYADASPGHEKHAVAILLVWYLIHFAVATWNCGLTVRARPNLLGNRCGAPELLFPLMLLKKHERSDAKYLSVLQALQVKQIIADYAQQILENSNIYAIKQGRLNRALAHLLWAMVPWLGVGVAMLSALLVPVADWMAVAVSGVVSVGAALAVGRILSPRFIDSGA